MTECARCAKPSKPTDHYCTRCGALLDEGAPVDSVSASAEPTRLTTAAQVSRGLDRRWITGGLAALALIVVGWVATGQRPDPEAGVPTTAPSDLTARGITTTSSGQVTGGLANPDQGPLIDAPDGLHLYLEHRLGVIDIDLVAGTQERLAVTGAPVLVHDSWLVTVGRDSNHEISTVDALDLTTGAVTHLADEPEEVEGRAGAADGDNPVWVRYDQDGQAWWVAVDLESGRTLRAVRADGSGGPDLVSSGPEVVGSSAGGVFALDDDGTYRRVDDGALLAAGGGRALVRHCVAPARCELGWVDTGSWESLDLALPTNPVLWAAALSTNGQVLVFGTTASDGGPMIVVFDVATGEEQVIPDGYLPVSVTADGGYVAAHSRARGSREGEVSVLDVARQELTHIAVLTGPDLTSLLLVEGDREEAG